MTDKITLANLANLQNETTAVNAINNNNAAITTAMDNTLSRDGTSPNQMGANLDMNNNTILNLPIPSSPTQPLRLADLTSFNAGTFTVNTLPVGGTTNQILKKNSGANYDAAWTSTPVFTSETTGPITLTGATSGSTVLQPTAIASGTLTLPATTDTLTGKATTDTLTNKTIDTAGPNTIKIAGTSLTAVTGTNNVVLSTGPTLTGVNIAAGTASVDPITLTAGTNLTVPVAGSMEYDGNCFYETPVASNRAVVATEHFVVLASDYTFSSATGAQKCFNATPNGALTLPSNTAYFFEALYIITNNGTNSHTWSSSFGGTATFTQFTYSVMGRTDSSSTPSGSNMQMGDAVNTAGAIVMNSTGQTSATENAMFVLKGMFRVNAGGTLIPQISSSAVTSTPAMKAGSYFRCWPIGVGNVATVGNWS